MNSTKNITNQLFSCLQQKKVTLPSQRQPPIGSKTEKDFRMGTLTLEAVLDSLRPVRPVPRGGDTKRRVRRWRLARDPAGHQIGRNGRQGCCREKLAEGGVIHRLLRIGNLPPC